MSDFEDLAFLREYSAHDVDTLMSRWAALVERYSLSATPLGEDAGHPIMVFETPKRKEGPSIYLSAGVHGDEVAPLWGLLFWAEAELGKWLKKGFQFLIFPCFNPFGVIENTRRNSEFRDLNRSFEDRSVPLIASWQDLIEGRKFDLSLQLHEDYDGRGVYIYELDREAEDHRLARRCLDACHEILPRDWRSSIDDSDFIDGILARGADEADVRQVAEVELDGWPEAIFLFLNNTPRALTFETPSEFSLVTRIRAQECLVEAAVSSIQG